MTDSALSKFVPPSLIEIYEHLDKCCGLLNQMKMLINSNLVQFYSHNHCDLISHSLQNELLEVSDENLYLIPTSELYMLDQETSNKSKNLDHICCQLIDISVKLKKCINGNL